MRDYLSRLAGRVRHVSPALQPLLPSIFEPARVGVSPWPTVEQSAIEQSSVAKIEAVPSKATPAVGVPSRSSTLDPPSIVSDGPAEKRQFERPVRTFVRDVLQVPPPPVTRTMRTTPHTTSAVVPLSESSTPPKPKDVSSGPLRPSVPREQAGSSVKPLRPVEIRSVERVSVQPATAAKPIASTLPTSIGRRPAEAQTKLAPPASTTPEIHVTIGRIEVRAISSPAPVQAPPRKPELSLDDYLRTRNQRAV